MILGVKVNNPNYSMKLNVCIKKSTVSYSIKIFTVAFCKFKPSIKWWISSGRNAVSLDEIVVYIVWQIGTYDAHEIADLL